jgi:hypothetical protein
VTGEKPVGEDLAVETAVGVTEQDGERDALVRREIRLQLIPFEDERLQGRIDDEGQPSHRGGDRRADRGPAGVELRQQGRV